MTPRAHVILAIVTAVAILIIFRLVRHRVLKAKYSLLWLTLGLAMALFAAVPGLLDWTAEQAGIGYPPLILVLLGLGLMGLLTMHFSYELSRTEGRVRTLAEEVTLLRRELEMRSTDDEPSERH